MPIPYALIGAGLIINDAYIPLAKKYADDWKLVAVWSRSQASVDAILPKLQEFSNDVEGYSGDSGLEIVLADVRIRAVLIALPAQNQLAAVQRALSAGKHVLEEKPIGATMQPALDAIKMYRTAYPKLLWALAENYRSEGVFLRARELVPELGDIIKIDLIADMPMTPANKYFSSAWRRQADQFPGGFIADGGVHYVAALRTVAHAAGVGEVVSAAGRCQSANPELPSPDTVVGYINFDTGKSATCSFSFAAAHVRFSLSFVGTKGSLEIQRGGWGVGRGQYYLNYKRPSDAEPVQEAFGFTGIESEILSFFKLVESLEKGSTVDPALEYRIAVEEGARDQAVIDALLRSHGSQGKLVEVARVPTAAQ